MTTPARFARTAQREFAKILRDMEHAGEAHPHRHLAEFEIRYNYRVRNGYDDGARAVEVIKGIVGKRLLYADSSAA